MASRIAEAYVQIVPRIDGVAGKLNSQLSGEMGKTGELSANKFSSGFKKILGPAVGLAAVAALGGFVKGAIAAGEESSTANARIKQIAESMNLFGDEADTVAKRLTDLAGKTALANGVDQNAIKLTQAKLLTFKELAATAGTVGGSFDRATQAAVDLGAAGFGTAESNAVQLGKALNDPIKGITALSRNGITFTEVEKEKIKALTESGQLFEAQNMILGAIETQVGGVAGATANMSDRLKVGGKQVMESFGEALLPIFNAIGTVLVDKVIPAVLRFTDSFKLFVEGIFNGEGVGGALSNIGKMVSDFFTGGGFATALNGLIALRQKFLDAFLKALPGIIDAIVAFIPVVIENTVTMVTSLITAITDSLPAIIDGAIKLFNGMITGLLQVLPVIITAVVEALPTVINAIVEAIPLIIQGAIKLFLGVIDGLIKALPVIITALVNALPKIIKAVTDALPLIIKGAITLFLGIIDGLTKALPQIIDAVIKALPEIVQALIDAVPLFIDAGLQLLKGLAKGIVDNVPTIIGTAIKGVGDFVIKTFKNLMGIKSPSTVFAGFGGDLMTGLANGITDTALAPAAALEEANKTIQEIYKQRMPMFFRIGEGVVNGLVGGILNVGGKIPDALDAILGLTGRARGVGVHGVMDTGLEGIQVDFDRLLGTLYAPFGGAQGMDLISSKSQKEANLRLMELAGGGVTQEGVMNAIFGNTTFLKGNKKITFSGGGLDPAIYAEKVQELLDAGFEQIAKPDMPRIDFIEKAAIALLDVVEGPKAEPKSDKKGGKKGGKKMGLGGFVNGPTNALIGEYGPEVVVPLNKFEQWMGLGETKGKTVNYYAAPNNSIDSEQALLQAMRRSAVVSGW